MISRRTLFKHAFVAAGYFATRKALARPENIHIGEEIREQQYLVPGVNRWINCTFHGVGIDLAEGVTQDDVDEYVLINNVFWLPT